LFDLTNQPPHRYHLHMDFDTDYYDAYNDDPWSAYKDSITDDEPDYDTPDFPDTPPTKKYIPQPGDPF
jgi:hypothetical protein